MVASSEDSEEETDQRTDCRPPDWPEEGDASNARKDRPYQGANQELPLYGNVEEAASLSNDAGNRTNTNWDGETQCIGEKDGEICGCAV